MLCINPVPRSTRRHISEGSQTIYGRTSLHRPPDIRLPTSVHPLNSDLAFPFCKQHGLLRPVRQDDQREHPEQYRRDALHEEQQPPVREHRVGVLDPERDEAAECARDGGAHVPPGDAQPDLLPRVEQRCAACMRNAERIGHSEGPPEVLTQI